MKMKKESDFRNILKIELVGFADGLAISCEEKREVKDRKENLWSCV